MNKALLAKLIIGLIVVIAMLLSKSNVIIFEGLVGGLMIAMPIGPIALLCINRTLNNGFKVGFYCGLGAAFADALYGGVAILSVKFVVNSLLHYQNYISIVGGIFLIYLGIKSYKSNNLNYNNQNNYISIYRAFGSTFLLTLSSPATILSFMALTTAYSNVLTFDKDYFSLLCIFGVFLGSSIWWLILTLLTSVVKKMILPKQLSIINSVSSLLIIICGIVFIFKPFLS